MGSTFNRSFYDVVVIGGGHAGCEAALAAARAGCSTLMLTPNLDRIGFMPCNPSIGGPGKSHLVAEIDALGGEMARAADRAALQIRELNSSKGPAVRAVRVQADKSLYALAMKEALELQQGLHLRQDEAVSLLLEGRAGECTRVRGVETRASGTITASAIVITAGTFLRGAMIAGEHRQPGGRWGDAADTKLAGSLGEIGLALRRFKTGTPPRIDARTID
ncbi:MAG: FAD-dependent oxidoreductase, partial [Chloroflexota bacterium]|nr:FAD-dependent oxidoreductase [Chloroflexota bacterium]